MDQRLETQLAHHGIWRAGTRSSAAIPGIPTGLAELDGLLPEGWPSGALTELLVGPEGSGALSLVMPALVRLGQEARWLAWVDPSYTPYAPALAQRGMALSRMLLIQAGGRPTDRLWATEQTLRSGACSAVLSWLETAEFRDLRRLQLAAATGDAWGILFRPGRALTEASPAALRLRVKSAARGGVIDLVKRRGGRTASLTLRHP